MQVFRVFPPVLMEQAVGDWTWLPGLVGKQAFCSSPFGDLFLEAPDGVYWLDHVEGALKREFDDREQMQRVITSTPEMQDHYLSAWLAIGAEQAGLSPGPEQIYAFKIPPVLGGKFEVENVILMDFIVYTSISGQLHRQVKDLAPGSQITGVVFDESPSEATASRKAGWFRKRR